MQTFRDDFYSEYDPEKKSPRATSESNSYDKPAKITDANLS